VSSYSLCIASTSTESNQRSTQTTLSLLHITDCVIFISDPTGLCCCHGLGGFVNTYVSGCHTCARNKVPRHKPYGPLNHSQIHHNLGSPSAWMPLSSSRHPKAMTPSWSLWIDSPNKPTLSLIQQRDLTHHFWLRCSGRTSCGFTAFPLISSQTEDRYCHDRELKLG